MGKSTIDKVSLLGDFRLHTTDDEDVAIRGKKNAALLASILLQPEKRINRGAAEALLWSQRSTQQAKASLRQSLSELREQLDGFSNVELITSRREISVALDEILLDVDEIVGVAASDSILRCSGACRSSRHRCWMKSLSSSADFGPRVRRITSSSRVW